MYFKIDQTIPCNTKNPPKVVINPVLIKKNKNRQSKATQLNLGKEYSILETFDNSQFMNNNSTFHQNFSKDDSKKADPIHMKSTTSSKQKADRKKFNSEIFRIIHEYSYIKSNQKINELNQGKNIIQKEYFRNNQCNISDDGLRGKSATKLGNRSNRFLYDNKMILRINTIKKFPNYKLSLKMIKNQCKNLNKYSYEDSIKQINNRKLNSNNVKSLNKTFMEGKEKAIQGEKENNNRTFFLINNQRKNQKSKNLDISNINLDSLRLHKKKNQFKNKLQKHENNHKNSSLARLNIKGIF